MAGRPKFTVNIKEKDLGFAHLLREAAKIKKKPFVKIGVTQSKGSKLHVVPGSDKQVMTVADIAKIHEYGAPDANIPERSFIRSTISKNEEKYNAHIAKLRDKIFDGNIQMTTEEALGFIGQEISSDIKNTIRNNETGLDEVKPLKYREGTPLLDTSQMLRAISYEPVMDGSQWTGEGSG